MYPSDFWRCVDFLCSAGWKVAEGKRFFDEKPTAQIKDVQECKQRFGESLTQRIDVIFKYTERENGVGAFARSITVVAVTRRFRTA